MGRAFSDTEKYGVFSVSLKGGITGEILSLLRRLRMTWASLQGL